jgi:hypothetical protein
MLGIMSVFVFCLAYSRLAARFGWLLSMMGGFVAYVTCTYLLDLTGISLAAGFVSVMMILVTCLALMPKPRLTDDTPASTKWEIPTRMVSATALVFIITGIAQLLGAQLTGLLTPFPVYATILAIFVHRSEGHAQAVRLLRGVVAGSFTFAVFFLVISSTILTLGLGVSFVCAIGMSLLTHIVSFMFLKRTENEI